MVPIMVLYTDLCFTFYHLTLWLCCNLLAFPHWWTFKWFTVVPYYNNTVKTFLYIYAFIFCVTNFSGTSSRREIMESNWMSIFLIYPVFWAFSLIPKPLSLVTFLECHRILKCPLESSQQDSELTFGGHISIFGLYHNHLTVRPPPGLQGSPGQDCPWIIFASWCGLACRKISMSDCFMEINWADG